MKSRIFSKFLWLSCGLLVSLGAFSQENGTFGSYLVGSYDLRNSNTMISVINPTARDLYIFVALLDDNENMLKCLTEYLSPNDIVELNIKKIIERTDSIQFGVVKIISLIDKRLDPSNVSPGIVGFQKHFYGKGCFRSGITESNMAAIPKEFLKGEIEILMRKCEQR